MRSSFLTAFAILVSFAAATAHADVRIKDITDVEGAHRNKLYGLGLVVGLGGTGGRSLATQQMAIDMLRKMDVTTKIARQGLLDNVFFSTNISAVMVTAELSPYSRVGSRIDVTVSVLDDAQSLQGGTLLLTPLKGADNEVYAIAQGPVSIGGYNLLAQAPQGALFNHRTVGNISNGGIVEKEALAELNQGPRLRLLLNEPDFDTAKQVAMVINQKFSGQARTIDPATIEILLSEMQQENIVEFISDCGNLEIDPDVVARVIINERTGTIIVGHQVRISTIAISHGNLVIRPEPETPEISPLGPAASALLGIDQDPPLDPNAAQAALNQQLAPGERVNVVEETMTVADLARALNALGTAPRDLVAIFQALKQSGALHAQLKMM